MQFFRIENPFGDISISPQLTLTGAAINILKGQIFNQTLGDPLEVEAPIRISDFGTPIVDVVKLSVNENMYIDVFGNIVPVNPVELTTCILDVDSPKTIVKTAINGREGTVKEWMSAGDKIISGTAIISAPDNVHPVDFIREVDLLMSAPAALNVSSVLLNEGYDVSKIVIESYKTSQMEGYRNTIMLTFSAASDSVIDVLDLNELNNQNELQSTFTYK